MPRQPASVQKPPAFSPSRALKVLTGQLGALQKLQGRHYQEAATQEAHWMNLTQSIIEAAFGHPSLRWTGFWQPALPERILLEAWAPASTSTTLMSAPDHALRCFPA